MSGNERDDAALRETVRALTEEFWSLHGRVTSRTELFIQLIGTFHACMVIRRPT